MKTTTTTITTTALDGGKVTFRAIARRRGRIGGRSMKLRLTAAQQAALECAGLEVDDDPEMTPLVTAWVGRGRDLVLDERDAASVEALAAAITDACNSEDATADRMRGDVAARRAALGACTSLSNLAARVWRIRRSLVG